jgi:hypothetical protein
MQQEIPKIQELQHKMQNPAAAVRNNLKNQKLLLLLPRESLRVEIGEENTREAKVKHQKDQQASLRPEAKVKHQKDQQPRQQRHHANHQATDRSHGEAEDRGSAIVAASHCEGKHKIDHSNAAGHDEERNPWSRMTSPAKNTDRKKEIGTQKQQALKIGAHKKEERTEEEKVDTGIMVTAAKEKMESGTMVTAAKEKIESGTTMRRAMIRAMIRATMSAAMRRAMISGTTIIAANRRAMVSGTMIAAAKEKIAAAKEKVVKAMISAAISGALGSGAMITAEMKRPHGNPNGQDVINPKVVLRKAPKLEKMLPLPIIKRRGSQDPRASE